MIMLLFPSSITISLLYRIGPTRLALMPSSFPKKIGLLSIVLKKELFPMPRVKSMTIFFIILKLAMETR